MTDDELDAITAEMRELQTQRRFCIKTQSRGDRSVEALIARFLEYSIDMDPAQRKIIYARAARIRLHIEKKKPGVPDDIPLTAEAIAACAPIVALSANSRLGWDLHRKQVESRMRQLATQLPGYNFVKTVTGFGELGFAIVVGEAGNLSNYARKERLWKRLGLAVINGMRQQRRTGTEEAKIHGFNPGRRAEIWMLTDSLFKHQWCGEDTAYRDAIRESAAWQVLSPQPDLAKMKGDHLKALAAELGVSAAAHPAGPYGEVYAARRAATTERGWTPKHSHSDALRIMSKRVLRDLWRAWRSDRAALQGTSEMRDAA